MRNVVVRRLVQNGVVLRADQNGSGAEVLFVVGAPLGVEDDVPVDPALGPVIQVLDDVRRIALADEPLAQLRALLLAALRHDEVLVRPQLVHALDVVEADLASPVGPRLVARIPVPVEGRAPDVLGRGAVRIDVARPREHPVAVVVPHQQLGIQPAGHESRPQVVPHKVALLGGREAAALPPLVRSRLVLHRKVGQRQAGLRHGLREAHVEARPGVADSGLSRPPWTIWPLSFIHPGGLHGLATRPRGWPATACAHRMTGMRDRS
mmetsp:Transcript_66004/g.204455  ORF Transcript_66004/g.204455 Transcript_66004/m.204455 type:complete len:265 (+) Transcript_66004:317-1111(+)